MAEERSALDALLGEMPKVAEAVNAFSSEAVQQQAFDALMAAFDGSAPKPAATKSEKTPRKRSTPKAKPKGNENGSGSKPKRKAAGGPSLVKELDLAPKGKQSLKEFAAEKNPKTNHERNVASVYYLSHVIDVSPVTLDHVFTCYRDMSWPLPASLENSLATTASRKRFLNTSDLANITLTPPGINLAEHGLPAKKKS